MGAMAQKMKAKYNLKDAGDFQKAATEITQHFDGQITNVPTYSAPTVDPNNPAVSQGTPGHTSFTFDIIGNSDHQLEAMIAAGYNSHPQHMSGIWGKANCRGGKVTVTLPSQYAVQNKNRIGGIVQDTVGLEGQKWAMEKNRNTNATKQNLEQVKQAELKDLDVLRQLS